MRLSFFTSYVSSTFLVFTLLMAFDATAVRHNEKGEPLAEDSDCKENGSRLITRPNASFPDQSGAAAAAAGAPLLPVRNDQDDEKAPAAPLVNFSKEWAALQQSPFKKLPTSLLEKILLQYLPHTTERYHPSLVCQKFRSAFKSKSHWETFIDKSGLQPRYDELRGPNPGLTAFEFCSRTCPKEWRAQKAFLEYQLKRNQQNKKAISHLMGISRNQHNKVIHRLDAEFLLQKFNVLPEGGWGVLILVESNQVSPEVLAQARLYRARLVFLELVADQTEHQGLLSKYIAQISQDETLPQVMRDAADFFLGVDATVHEEYTRKHFMFFTQISKNKELPQWMRDTANFCRGTMSAQNTNNVYRETRGPQLGANDIDDEEGFRLLTDASENAKLPQWMRNQANCRRGVMRAQNRTNAIDDAEAFRLLTDASENTKLDQWMRNQATYRRGAMRAQNRTDAIDDVEALRLLNNVCKYVGFRQQVEEEAKLFIGILQTRIKKSLRIDNR